MTSYESTINEIVRDIFGYLPSHWNRYGTNEEIITGFSIEIQRFSKQMQLLYERLSIDTAQAQYLDDIGKLFKLARDNGESDDSYRARIKAYFQAFSSGGTLEGMKNAIILMTGLNEDDITITEGTSWNPQQFIASMETSESWAGTGVSADTSNYFQGSQGIELTAGSATTITATLSKSLDLEMNKPSDYDEFRVWTYFPDITKINSISLKFSDGTTTAVNQQTTIDQTSRDFVYFEKSNFTNVDSIDWNSITSVVLEIDTNAATSVTFDWLQFGVIDKNMILDINLAIDSSIEDSILGKIKSVSQDSKAAGVYVNDVTFTSKNNLFRMNLSYLNGEDLI
jgi:hypothetical protein